MSAALGEFTGQLRDELPAALAGVESRPNAPQAAARR